MKIENTLDASGLECPLPLLKAKLELSKMSKGQIIKVISTDPTSEEDFKAFERMSGNVLLAIEKKEEKYFYLIQKKND